MDTPTPDRADRLPFGLRVWKEPGPCDAGVAEAYERARQSLWTGDPLDVIRAAFRGAVFDLRPAPPDVQPTCDWSVVIPVRGAHEQLARCIDAIWESMMGWEPRRVAEVVVVIPRDEAMEAACAANLATTRIVPCDEPLGFAAACNKGFEYSYGERVLFLNSDAYVPRRWREHFDIGLDHFHAVGPSGTNVSGFQLVPPADEGGHYVVGNAAVLRAPYPRLVGFCLAVRRESFIKVGGWNEEYGVGNFDDDDLSLRLALLSEKGHPSLGWTPACLVEHEGSASFRGLPDAAATYSRLMEENRVKFERRWGWATDVIYRWWGSL